MSTDANRPRPQGPVLDPELHATARRYGHATAAAARAQLNLAQLRLAVNLAEGENYQRLLALAVRIAEDDAREQDVTVAQAWAELTGGVR